MEIKQLIELEDGTAEFSATLSADELQFVANVGISYLLQQGALPFQMQDDAEKTKSTLVVPESEHAH